MIKTSNFESNTTVDFNKYLEDIADQMSNWYAPAAQKPKENPREMVSLQSFKRRWNYFLSMRKIILETPPIVIQPGQMIQIPETTVEAICGKIKYRMDSQGVLALVDSSEKYIHLERPSDELIKRFSKPREEERRYDYQPLRVSRVVTYTEDLNQFGFKLENRKTAKARRRKFQRV